MAETTMVAARRPAAPVRTAAPREAAQAGSPERWAALVGGAVFGVVGLRRGGVSGALLAGAGGALMVCGAAGYPLLGMVRAAAARLPAAEPSPAVCVVTVNRPPERLYRFWRNFANLPRLIDGLERVEILDDRRSHWIAKRPDGVRWAWDVEIVHDEPGRALSWRSVGSPDLDCTGSIEFRPAPGRRGTEVRGTLDVRTPGFAALSGLPAGLHVQDTLRRFKQVMEAGEAVTTTGQPAGERSWLGRVAEEAEA